VCVLVFSPLRVAWALAALRAHVQRIGAVELDVLVASERFRNPSGPGRCSDALLILRQQACISRIIRGKQQGGICTDIVCLYIPAGSAQLGFPRQIDRSKYRKLPFLQLS
jgi:hypothetical protein